MGKCTSEGAFYREEEKYTILSFFSRPGRQGPVGPKGVFDPNLAEKGKKGSIGKQGEIGINSFVCYSKYLKL